MEIDTSKLTDEQISKLGEFVHKMEEENTKATKWWIMPRYPIFGAEVQQFGQSYYVEPQKDSYSRSKPPLKMSFNSKEEAQEWLDNYLSEDTLFSNAINDVNKLKNNLNAIISKLKNHKYLTDTDIFNCYTEFNDSKVYGAISKVTGCER